MNNSYIVEIQETNDGSGDFILPIPPEILKSLDLKEGDDINFEIKNGSIYMSKVIK